MEQQNKTRPSMGDIRPSRSMDMRRPSTRQPEPSPSVRPDRPAPLAQRTRQQDVRPVSQPLARQGAQPLPAQRPSAPVIPQPKPVLEQKASKGNSFWRGLLQVVISLLIIVGVAAVIVALYLRYYQ